MTPAVEPPNANEYPTMKNTSRDIMKIIMFLVTTKLRFFGLTYAISSSVYPTNIINTNEVDVMVQAEVMPWSIPIGRDQRSKA